MTRCAWIFVVALTGCPRPDAVIAPPAADPHRSADAMAWYLRAKMAEQAGDFAETERSWAWVLRLDRASPWPLAGYATFLEGAGRTEEALATWEQAAALATEPAIEAGLGRVLVALGRDAEAVPHLEAAVAGGVFDAWEALLRADPSRSGDAVDALLPRLDDEEAGPDAAAALVPVMGASCRYATVGAWLDRTGAWDREPPWSYVALEAARALGSPRHAELLRREDPLAASIQEGRALAAAGQHADVLTWARLAQPGPWTEILRIISLVELGRAREAEALAVRASAAYPEDPTVAMALAAARLAHGKPVGDALDRLPEPARSERLADAAWLAGDGKLAEEALRTALDLGSALAARQLVAVLEVRGDDARAIAARWTELEPGSADAWLALARHDPGQSVSALDRALHADPCHPEARFLGAEAARSDCALWLAAWETAPNDPRLAPGREACPGIPGPLEVP